MQPMPTPEYRDDSGAVHHEGDLVYDYYTGELVRIGTARQHGWFDSLKPTGVGSSSAVILNGQRIMSVEEARRQKLPGAEGVASENTLRLREQTPRPCQSPLHDDLTCQAARLRPDLMCDNCALEEDDECPGHESLAGEHMGETVFCDGSCLKRR